MKKEISEAVLLTNATSVGMAPHEDASPIEDMGMLHEGLGVFDIIYNPPVTLLMKQAKSVGCRAANGKLMLLYQGAESFKIWTGKEMPVEKVKAALFSD